MSDEINWLSLESKWDGFCKECGKKIPKGSMIKWAKGHGAIHEVCPVIADPHKEDTTQLIIDDGIDDSYLWKDDKQYSYTELLKINNCQKCGIDLRNKDVWISNDRKTCEKCHK